MLYTKILYHFMNHFQDGWEEIIHKHASDKALCMQKSTSKTIPCYHDNNDSCLSELP